MAVLVALFIEWVSRQRIAVALASFLGMLGLFIANRYEMKEAVDNDARAGRGPRYEFLALHPRHHRDRGLFRRLAGGGHGPRLYPRSALGLSVPDSWCSMPVFRAWFTGCSALACSSRRSAPSLAALGPDESWGRFWGWDRKENGASWIVLWCLIVLHARRGGYIGALGTNIGAVILAMVVGFSWWGAAIRWVGLTVMASPAGL